MELPRWIQASIHILFLLASLVVNIAEMYGFQGSHFGDQTLHWYGNPTPHFRISSTVLVLLGFFWATWVGCFIRTVALGRSGDSYHTETSLPDNQKRILLVDSDGFLRQCSECGILQRSRAFHCSAVKSCLPLYDHWCPYLLSPIWLGNQIPYAIGMTAASCYFAVLAVSIGLGWRAKSTRGAWLYVNTAAFAAVLYGLSIQWWTYRMWQRFVWRNLRHKETNYNGWLIGTGNGGFQITERIGLSNNPWNLGWKCNFAQFFTGPEMVPGSSWPVNPHLLLRIAQVDELPPRASRPGFGTPMDRSVSTSLESEGSNGIPLRRLRRTLTDSTDPPRDRYLADSTESGSSSAGTWSLI